MNDSVTAKNESLAAKSLEIVACVIGLAVGRYSGLNLLIPLLFTGVAWWLATKFLPEHNKLIAPAFAVQCGHAVWMALGLVSLGAINENAFDIVLVAGGLAWLVAKPGAGPLYLLGGYQLVALLINGYLLYDAEVGGAAHKALLVHVAWRVLALFFIVQVFFKVREVSTETAGAH